MTRPYTIDVASRSALVICNACGHRYLAPTRMAALHYAVDHEQRVHPEQMTAREALKKATQRHAASA